MPPKKFQFFPHVRLLVIPKTAANSSNRVSEEAPISIVPSSDPASALPPRSPAAPSPLSRSAPPPSPSSSGQVRVDAGAHDAFVVIPAYSTGDSSACATSEIAADLAMGIPAINSNEVAYTKELYLCIAAVAAICRYIRRPRWQIHRFARERIPWIRVRSVFSVEPAAGWRNGRECGCARFAGNHWYLGRGCRYGYYAGNPENHFAAQTVGQV
ncbi:hypothetical protein LshimejAT787_0700280 [Lyophyllum shimeji]|uniref:Uncharacterized protein n=1 Tax=Lyophyllum shimeji TaxID=47721 RepID=A0A9P3UNC0_LYOSH|nr:hypothetical protein LshimejAT787_0700280 [Lyophyllum shimeji]